MCSDFAGISAARATKNKSRVRRFTTSKVGSSGATAVPKSPKVVPAPTPSEERVYDTNPRNFWSPREFDLSPAGEDCLKYFLNETAAVRSKTLQDYPEISDFVSQNQMLERVSFGDVALPPLRVAVTGAAGAIGYALLARIASGAAFGEKRRVILQLLELPQALQALKGVEMELRDSAFPLIDDIVVTDNVEKAFEGVDYALLVGAQPRKEGMERGDLLLKNAEIFSIQGKALNKVGKGKDTRVAVVGNPANTNAMIAQRNAPKIPPPNFMAMTRLDHTRALAQVALKAQCSINDIKNMVIWGNHSATQFPDLTHAYIGGKPALQVINDSSWVDNDFIPTVQKRGAAILAARKVSSAASAAAALVQMVRIWEFGSLNWTSGAVYSNGEYGVDKGLFFSYPLVHDPNKGGQWSVVQNLPFDDKALQRFATTLDELKKERDGVAKYL